MPKGHRLEESIIHEQMEETTAGAWSSSSSTISGASDRDGARGYAASREVSQVDQANLHGAGAPEMTSEEKPRQNNSEKNMTPVTEGGPGEEFSSAILSSEAERILDNAKKRLTVRSSKGWYDMADRLAHGGQSLQGSFLSATDAVAVTVAFSVSWSPAFGARSTGGRTLPIDIPQRSQGLCGPSPSSDV